MMRDTRTQHRPASPQVNDRGRVSGTHRLVETYNKPWLFPQALNIVERVINERVDYEPGVDPRELCNVRYTTLLVERIAAALRAGEGHSGALLPVLDEYEPIGSTDRIAFYTSKLCVRTNKSHISHAVCDSKLEARIARARVLRLSSTRRWCCELNQLWQALGRT